jgi:hypothetical protein
MTAIYMAGPDTRNRQPHRHTVLDPPVLPDQFGAGDGPVNGRRLPLGRVAGRVLLGYGAEPFQGLPGKAAIGQFLNPVGQPAFQKAPVIGWRFGLKQLAPFRLQYRR